MRDNEHESVGGRVCTVHARVCARARTSERGTQRGIPHPIDQPISSTKAKELNLLRDVLLSFPSRTLNSRLPYSGDFHRHVVRGFEGNKIIASASLDPRFALSMQYASASSPNLFRYRGPCTRRTRHATRRHSYGTIESMPRFVQSWDTVNHGKRFVGSQGLVPTLLFRHRGACAPSKTIYTSRNGLQHLK